MKKLLFISPFFFPELISTAKYNTHLVEAMAAAGWQVTVIASHPFYPEWKPRRSQENPDGVRVLRGGSRIRYSRFPLLRRALLELWFSFHVCRQMFRKDIRSCDLAVAVLPPSFFLLPVLGFLTPVVPVCAIVHDLQGVYAKNSGGLHKLLASMIHALEGWGLRRCRHTFFLSEQMAEVAAATYSLDPAKLSVSYPFVTLDVEGSTSDDLVQLFPADKKHVVYSGALGLKQNPAMLTEFFGKAQELFPEVEFHIFSAGPLFEAVREQNDRTFQTVRFHGFVPEKNLVELYRRSSVQVVPQLEGTSAASIPSKLPNIIATKRPVLAICDKGSEVERIVARYGLGRAISSWDFGQFTAALSELLQMDTTMPSVSSAFTSDELLDRFKVVSGWQ